MSIDTVAEWLRRGPAIAYKLICFACVSSNLVGVENFYIIILRPGDLGILLFDALLRLEMKNNPFEYVG
jgi:hypothetical protein